ncbi:MAG: ComEA family DNA-binding protein [Pseudomonadota bacterium]
MFRLLLVLFACLLLASPAWAEPVNINTASQAELETLPGIGPAKASAIIAYRDANGAFSTPAELDNVPGIGPATLAQLTPLVTVGGAAEVAPAPAPAPALESEPTPEPRPRRQSSSALGLTIEPAGDEPPAPPPSSGLPIEPAPSGARININTASAAQLDELPGIGASKAAAILADREANGPFSSCADLDRVQGIGPTTVANLESMCSVK